MNKENEYKWKDKLFNYLKDEHDLVLLDSQLTDILYIVLGSQEYIEFCNYKKK